MHEEFYELMFVNHKKHVCHFFKLHFLKKRKKKLEVLLMKFFKLTCNEKLKLKRVQGITISYVYNLKGIRVTVT